MQKAKQVSGTCLLIIESKSLIFSGMVAALDDSVGYVVRTLKNKGMMDNTIILFTTDNGGPSNGFNNNAASNFPLRYILC